MNPEPITIPNGKTPLQLRGELERAIEPLMDVQTFYVACARIEAVIHAAFEATDKAGDE